MQNLLTRKTHPIAAIISAGKRVFINKSDISKRYPLKQALDLYAKTNLKWNNHKIIIFKNRQEFIDYHFKSKIGRATQCLRTAQRRHRYKKDTDSLRQYQRAALERVLLYLEHGKIPGNNFEDIELYKLVTSIQNPWIK